MITLSVITLSVITLSMIALATFAPDIQGYRISMPKALSLKATQKIRLQIYSLPDVRKRV
jgi:hypothetical protein